MMFNSPNYSSAYSILPRETSLRSGTGADCDYLFRCELCGTSGASLRLPAQSSSPCVAHVITARQPFKVIGGIVALISVTMIRLVQNGWRIAVERQVYYLVKTVGGLPAIFLQFDLGVSCPFIDSGRQNQADYCSFCGTDSSYARLIADFIESFVADNRKPSFWGRLIEHWNLLSSGVMRAAAPTARPLNYSIAGG